jgi:hypothetical protein
VRATVTHGIIAASGHRQHYFLPVDDYLFLGAIREFAGIACFNIVPHIVLPKKEYRVTVALFFLFF